MTLYIAWAVRTALLVLYIPVQILVIIVRAAHRLDLWASAVVMQSAIKFKFVATDRKVIDCRWFPTREPCDIAISGSEEGVLDVAVQHFVQSHGQRNTPELRDELRSMLRHEVESKAA